MIMDKIVIIGSGPAGIGAAFELAHSRKKIISKNITIFDKNDKIGGLARTYTYKNHFFDIGPHRFYTRNLEVLKFWKNILGKDLVKVTRLTRIYYNNKLFMYPIELRDVFKKLGPYESFLCFFSFVKVKCSIKKPPHSFEDWITQKFGRKLYEMFFKSYTEKVWGISCNQIGAEWAEQRIKKVDFIEIVKNLFVSSNAKSLIHEFYYPKHGAGNMYERAAQLIQKNGGQIKLNSKVIKIKHKNNFVDCLYYEIDGKLFEQSADYVFASLPITEFVYSLSPRAPLYVLNAAKKLYYRDHITVNLLVKESTFPDNWIYIHDPNVKMARVTNYSNFISKDRPGSAISVEYFAFAEDKIWRLSDKKLIELAKSELSKTGLIPKEHITDGFIIREKDAYPTYYTGHKKSFEIIKKYIDSFKNVQLIGRGGMYKYNNMDHSLYSGMLAARNYLLGESKYDIWKINEDAEYLEK